jgi:hypothetical protein
VTAEDLIRIVQEAGGTLRVDKDWVWVRPKRVAAPALQEAGLAVRPLAGGGAGARPTATGAEDT